MNTNKAEPKQGDRVKPVPPKRPSKPVTPRVLNEKVLNKREITLEIS